MTQKELQERINQLQEMISLGVSTEEYEGTSLDKEVAEFLISKSRVYNDSDFRRMAIKLIGKKKVVLTTLNLNIPLWEEDIEYLKLALENIK